jgi:hypothetical protein
VICHTLFRHSCRSIKLKISSNTFLEGVKIPADPPKEPSKLKHVFLIEVLDPIATNKQGYREEIHL